MHQSLRLISLTSVLIVLSACGDGDRIVGSCNAMNMDDGSSICIDATADSEELTRGLCRVGSGRWMAGESCKTESAIGGCEQSNGAVMWMYPSDKTEDIDDVIAACSGRVLTDPADL